MFVESRGPIPLPQRGRMFVESRGPIPLPQRGSMFVESRGPIPLPQRGSMFVESRGPILLPQRGSMFVERAIRYIYLREALVPIKTSKKCGRYSLTRYLSVSYTVSGLRLGSSPSEPQARTVNCLHVIFARGALKM